MNMRFEIGELTAAMEYLFAAYPELQDDEQLRADMLTGETDIESVMTRLVRQAQEARHDASSVAQWIGELASRKTRHERREEAMRDVIQSLMNKANVSKLKLPEATISVTERAPKPVITDEAALPSELIKTIRKPDVAAINELYKTTGQLPAGCALSNGSTVLTLSTK